MRTRINRLVTLTAVAVLAALGLSAPAQATPWPYFHIKNYHSGKCLQPQSYSPNALIEQRDCLGSRIEDSIQHWDLDTELGGGYRWIRNRATGYCMDLQANSPEEVGNGTLVQQFYCDATSSGEAWSLTPARLDHVQMHPRAAQRLCADVQNRSSANGALLQVWSCTLAEPAQNFKPY
jgi:hypothetical protein